MNVLGEIKKSLWNGRMAHAYILEAPAGEARDRLMTNILQEILCRNPDLEQRPCGLCEACRRVAAGSHEDVIYMKKSKLEEGKTKTNKVFSSHKLSLYNNSQKQSSRTNIASL